MLCLCMARSGGMARLAVVALATGLAVLSIAVVGRGAGAPPPAVLIRWGITPAPRADHQVTLEGGLTVQAGIEFVGVGPGCLRIGGTADYERRFQLVDVLGFGSPSTLARPGWAELDRPFRISCREITNAQFEEFAPRHERSPVKPGSAQGSGCRSRSSGRRSSGRISSTLAWPTGRRARGGPRSEECRSSSGARIPTGRTPLSGRGWSGTPEILRTVRPEPCGEAGSPIPEAPSRSRTMAFSTCSGVVPVRPPSRTMKSASAS